MDAAFCAGVPGFIFYEWQATEGHAAVPPRWSTNKGFDARDAGFVAMLQNYRFPYPVQVNSTYSAATGGGCYEEGAAASVAVDQTMITLQDGTHAVFAGWTGNITSTEPRLTLTISSPLSVTAVWQIQR